MDDKIGIIGNDSKCKTTFAEYIHEFYPDMHFFESQLEMLANIVRYPNTAIYMPEATVMQCDVEDRVPDYMIMEYQRMDELFIAECISDKPELSINDIKRKIKYSKNQLEILHLSRRLNAMYKNKYQNKRK